MDEFRGFSDGALAFLAGLETNNKKAWFDKRFVSWCVTRFKKTEPIHRWLVAEVL